MIAVRTVFENKLTRAENDANGNEIVIASSGKYKVATIFTTGASSNSAIRELLSRTGLYSLYVSAKEDHLEMGDFEVTTNLAHRAGMKTLGVIGIGVQVRNQGNTSKHIR